MTIFVGPPKLIPPVELWRLVRHTLHKKGTQGLVDMLTMLPVLKQKYPLANINKCIKSCTID